jgi:hypothetical protein
MARLAGVALWSAAILLCAAHATAFTLTVKANGGCTGAAVRSVHVGLTSLVCAPFAFDTRPIHCCMRRVSIHN